LGIYGKGRSPLVGDVQSSYLGISLVIVSILFLFVKNKNGAKNIIFNGRVKFIV
jgi:hypothetical protein